MAKKTKAGAEGDAPGTDGTGTPPQGQPYVVLARKYRPQTFDDLIGQEAMVTTLRNAFQSGRIAQGYMLTGVRGVGKTTTARILARALNYETDTVHKPTIDMPVLGRHCVDIIDSRHPDVIEMDAASNTGIDNIREIIENARYKPLVARTKVFVIDEVHMLSKGAFNALLKTLEEPPEHVKFIFATTEIRKVPVTVLSRCQRFDLRRVDVPLLTKHFAMIVANEGATAEDEALRAIARSAEGSVRDGLSILDQAIAMGQGSVTSDGVRAMLGLADRGRIFDLLQQVMRGDTAAALASLSDLVRDGAEPARVLADVAEAVHLAARLKAVGAEAGGELVSAEEARRAVAIGEAASVALLARAWQLLLKGLEEADKAPNPLAAAEMVLIRLAYTADLPAPDEIIAALGAATRPARKPGEAPPAPRREDRPVINAAPAQQPAADSVPPESENPAGFAGAGDFASAFDDAAAGDAVGLALDGDAVDAMAAAPPRPLNTFADVLALVGEKRDARLKIHLEDNVSLVKFDATGAIDIFLLPAAPRELANDLREKLNRWTGRQWIVVLSKQPGERPVGEVNRERKAAELAELKAHPAVAAVLDAFPGAEIREVRPLLAAAKKDATGG
jgi:DNA polymerase-3 subunit gamma/tau